MRLYDIVSAPWALTPEMFSEVQGIYARHVRGEKINIKDIEARVGAPLNNQRPAMQVENGVALIAMEGVLAKRSNLMSQVSGMSSMQMIGNDIRQAIDNPAVNSIILMIDSPGGTVDGTQELANIIASARGTKPIITFADGVMASAAYWIGSAADKVFISGDTTTVGSIGVVATHVDVSGMEAKDGVKTTEISAGKYKRIASQYAPLSEEGRADIQEKVDYFYSIFVDAVAQNRGVSVENVLEKMADGRVFIGQQAIKAGLVDGVSTLDGLIARAAAGEFTAAKTGAGDALSQTTIKETDMDIAKLKADYPDIANALIEEGRVAGVAAGAEAERKRIQDVESQMLPGHAELIAALKFDGKTSGAEAAVKVLNAEREKRGTKLADLRADGQEPAKVPASGADASKKPAAEDESKPIEERCKAKWDADSKLRASFADSFETYLAIEKADAAGRFKVIGQKAA